MLPIDIVLSLMDPNTNHSQIIKQAWNQDVEYFWIGLSMSSSPDYDFGLEKVPALDESDDEPGTLTFPAFLKLATALSRGELVGAAAQEAVEEAALLADAREWNLWYRRILLKSLPKYLPMETIQKELIRLTTE